MVGGEGRDKVALDACAGFIGILGKRRGSIPGERDTQPERDGTGRMDTCAAISIVDLSRK